MARRERGSTPADAAPPVAAALDRETAACTPRGPAGLQQPTHAVSDQPGRTTSTKQTSMELLGRRTEPSDLLERKEAGHDAQRVRAGTIHREQGITQDSSKRGRTHTSLLTRAGGHLQSR